MLRMQIERYLLSVEMKRRWFINHWGVWNHSVWKWFLVWRNSGIALVPWWCVTACVCVCVFARGCSLRWQYLLVSGHSATIATDNICLSQAFLRFCLALLRVLTQQSYTLTVVLHLNCLTRLQELTRSYTPLMFTVCHWITTLLSLLIAELNSFHY